MSVITKLEDGREIDDTFMVSIDSINILKEMLADDKTCDESGELTEYGNKKLKKLQKKWCLEKQHENYNTEDYVK